MDLLEATRLIEANANFRLLRRVPALGDWPLKAASGETRRGVFVDTETTGLDQETDEVIELALLPFEYERDTGAIARVDADAALSAFRQPSFPISPESGKIHGITDEMVKGDVIGPERI
jgi:DNA polymerase-3 subunit epsilon